jgi:holo-[acyl-carrier protein] synthase
MILGIGVDLVEVARIEQAIARHGEPFLHRIFTADEIAYCSKMKSPAPHYAARFAAKEAVSKAFGTGIGAQLGWHDIEVRREESGKPSIILHGDGAALASARGAREIHLSLSHTTAYAVAQVVIDGGDS